MSHFKFHPSSGEIIPNNSQYSFPVQTTKTFKSCIKIPPKNGATFVNNSNNILRFEFPSTGYMNPKNTFFEFDCQLDGGTSGANTRFQNGIASTFRRVRLLYGSTVIEDIQDYNVINRLLIEHTVQDQDTLTAQTIAQGIGGFTTQPAQTTAALVTNTRLTRIQAVTADTSPINDTLNPRRYVVSFILGLFTQPKLIPLKFLASQLAIEIELAPSRDCICNSAGAVPTFTISNSNIITELIEYDGSYDAAFLQGLKSGVPIHFSSWHTWKSSVSKNIDVNINERSRSVKAAFAAILPPSSLLVDSHAMITGTGTGTIEEYQWRLGGKYYPSQPVVCGQSGVNLGCAEAYVELQKALNIVGNNQFSTGCHLDKYNSICILDGGDAASTPLTRTMAATSRLAKVFSGGAANFVTGIDLETSNGLEISGMNAEEQNDLIYHAKYSDLDITYQLYLFTYFDLLLIIKEGNVIDLIW
jgi:hypothetical protein